MLRWIFLVVLLMWGHLCSVSQPDTLTGSSVVIFSLFGALSRVCMFISMSPRKFIQHLCVSLPQRGSFCSLSVLSGRRVWLRRLSYTLFYSRKGAWQLSVKREALHQKNS